MTTLAFIGDVMLGRGVNEELRRVPPETLWGTTLPVIREVDAVIANLACAITRQQTPPAASPRMFPLRADAVAADVLATGNVRCVSLANEHALDYGEEGLFDTLDALDHLRIAHAGAGRVLGQAAAPAIVHLPDLTVAVVGLTDHEPSFAATPHAAGTHYLDISAGPPPAIGLVQLASHCRERKADVAVLSVHWATDMFTTPPGPFREFAHTAIEAGFDVVHGHSGHLTQGVEIYCGRPIFYDAATFIGDDPAATSFLYLVDVTSSLRFQRVRLVPVRLRSGRVNVAMSDDAKAINRQMAVRCAALGSSVTEANGTLIIECADAADAARASCFTNGLIGAPKQIAH
jgi:poly-gamma-glutamate capsule biosynthesis protein CapA/YwtB (metallophosphatase superfamily)